MFLPRSLRRAAAAALVILVPAAGVLSGAEKKRDRLKEAADKLNGLATKPGPSEEQAFLHARASVLLERARQTGDSYVADRLRRAIDDLLEASQTIFESRQRDRKADRDDQEDSARRLERAYFRVQQGPYFGRLSGEPDAPEYIQHAQRLYQQARTAYDGKRWREAEKLAEASSDIIEALERLAQARVRIPEPPRLP
jgi:hypothetical protein